MSGKGIAAVLGAGLLVATLAARQDGRAAAGTGRRDGSAATLSDLRAMRRAIDRLECETALGATRKPYVVLDLEGSRILFRLMGMTVREVPIQSIEAGRLLAASLSGRSQEPASSVAGIFTLQEKEGDPRLAPLTPEQIEAGLDDENAADALPPEPPASYDLFFKEPVKLRIAGSPRSGAVGGVLASMTSLWRDLVGRGGEGRGREVAFRVTIRIEETAAREIYRALVPGERWLVLPPAGLILPEARQEPPRSIRAAAPAPRPSPAPKPSEPGVPFRIPPPVEIDASGAPGPEPSPAPAAGPELAAPAPDSSPGARPDDGAAAPPPADSAAPAPNPTP